MFEIFKNIIEIEYEITKLDTRLVLEQRFRYFVFTKRYMYVNYRIQNKRQ